MPSIAGSYIRKWTVCRRGHTRYQKSKKELLKGPRTSPNDAITQPNQPAAFGCQGGPFSICSKGKLSKGKSWGKQLRRQSRQISVCRNHTTRWRQMLCGAGLPACYAWIRVRRVRSVWGVFGARCLLSFPWTNVCNDGVETEARMLLASYRCSFLVVYEMICLHM